MNQKKTRKVVVRQVERMRRPRPWWCPRFVHRAAVWLVFRDRPIWEQQRDRLVKP